MGCHTPECMGEHATGTISHSVVYREKTIVLHHVPADVCPECGDAVLSEETTVAIEDLLRRRTIRSKKSVFVYEA